MLMRYATIWGLPPPPVAFSNELTVGMIRSNESSAAVGRQEVVKGVSHDGEKMEFLKP